MTIPTPPPELHLESEADTAKLAAAFAQAMQAGDVLLINGGLAAGKTFFVRAAVAALGSSDTVSSPTYTLANIYACSKGPVVHMDAYRLENAADSVDLALEDEFACGLAFIEWGAMLASEFDDFVSLDLGHVPAQEHARIATFASEGPRGGELLAQVLEAFAA